MELILARHGETEWNKEEIFRGRSEVPLNENGQRQAKLLAGFLKASKLEAVYTSPVRRAQQTAGAVSRASGLVCTVAEGLTDMDFGEWEGLAQEKIKTHPLYRQWLEHPEAVRMPRGESLEDVRRRSLPVIGEIVKKHTGRVAVVSHRVVIKVLVCALLGLDDSHFWNIKSDTGAVTVFSYEKNGFVLDRHNENCYLAETRGNLVDF